MSERTLHGARVKRVYVAVEIEGADGTLYRHEAMGEPGYGQGIRLDPSHGPLGDPTSVYVGMEVTLTPIEGEALYVTTEVPAPAPQIAPGGVVTLTER